MTEQEGVAHEEATEEVMTSTEEIEQPETDEAPENEGEQPEEKAEKPEPETPEDDPDDKPKSRHQKRKEAMQRAFKEADEAKKAAAEAEAKLRRVQEAAQSAKPPVESDFNSYDEYQAALAGFYAMKQLDQREESRTKEEYEAQQKRVKQIEEQHRQEVAQNWAAQVEDARGRYADFDRVVYAPNVPIAPHIAEIVAQMDSGPDVAYHLGTNTDEAARISQLPPMQAAMELGRIEASLSRPKPRTTTNAPDPVNPVKAKGTAEKDWRDMSPEEYDAWRAKGGVPN